MKLTKSQKFKGSWILYQTDFVNNVILDFEELCELGGKIEEIKELKSQNIMKE